MSVCSFVRMHSLEEVCSLHDSLALHFAFGHLGAVVLTVLLENALALEEVEGASSETPHSHGVLAEKASHGLDHGVLFHSLSLQLDHVDGIGTDYLPF